MQPIAMDGVAWSVCWSVGLSVMTASPAKMAELIMMPFGTLKKLFYPFMF